MPPGKTIVVQFNDRNQPIRKEGRKLSSFLGIISRTPELTPVNIDDWRNFAKKEKKKLVEFVKKNFSIPSRGEAYVIKSIGKKWRDHKCYLKNIYTAKYKTKDALLRNRPSRIPHDRWTGLVSYWLSDKAKKRTQANRNNRANQMMPHTGGSQRIAALMDEKAENGIEPTRAHVFMLTHGRPMDAEFARTIDMLNERLSNNERSNDQSPRGVAWETIKVENSSNEAIKFFQKEIIELKELNGKQNEETHLMKQEVSWMRQVMYKITPNELFMPHNVNGMSTEQVCDAYSGHQPVPQARQMPTTAKNAHSSHGYTL